MKSALIYLWTFPTTAVGLLFFCLAILTGGRAQLIDGVLEVYGGAVRVFLRRFTLLKGGASAMTLGHVVIGQDRDSLDWSRPHERVHVRQCERWGPFFLPAYVLASLWMLLRGRNPYRDNPFEREAYGNASPVSDDD